MPDRHGRQAGTTEHTIATSTTPASNAPAGQTTEDVQRLSIVLVFDGGARGNPGDGYGSYLVRGALNTSEPVRLEFGPAITNNQAEYMTLIAALRAILSGLERRSIAPSRVALDIWSDSQLVVEQVNGRWKVRDAGLRTLVDDARRLLGSFRSWALSWHPRSVSVRLLGH